MCWFDICFLCQSCAEGEEEEEEEGKEKTFEVLLIFRKMFCIPVVFPNQFKSNE